MDDVSSFFLTFINWGLAFEVGFEQRGVGHGDPGRLLTRQHVQLFLELIQLVQTSEHERILGRIAEVLGKKELIPCYVAAMCG